VLSPQLVDQPVAREHLAGMEQQEREHGALLRPSDGELTPVVVNRHQRP
jgi:hypothetical protein